jgi:Rho GTPase-activating protein 1
MDSHNLAVVLCPNLVASGDPAKDVAICAVPGIKTMSGAAPFSPTPGQATLGMVIKICIERYYEIFDEVRDRSEPVDASHLDPNVGDVTPSSGNSSPDPAQYDDAEEHPSVLEEEEEEIDDAVLVMPLGPSSSNSTGNLKGKGNSTAALSAATAAGSNPPYEPRHRKKKSQPNMRSSTSTHASAYTAASGPSPNHVYTSQGKAKSTISIGSTSFKNKHGTISVGRSTKGKSVGSGVEAMGVTAAGFFSSPPR